MDIGYFLKLMTEKHASDMFLTTGAPVYIKIEGKLYPLGSTGLPPGMVKKIAYSLMDEGQVPQFERELELNMAIALPDAGRFRVVTWEVDVDGQRGERQRKTERTVSEDGSPQHPIPPAAEGGRLSVPARWFARRAKWRRKRRQSLRRRSVQSSGFPGKNGRHHRHECP